MPEEHRHYAEWTPERFERWAKTIGPQKALLVKSVMVAREHPQQGYRSSMGIIRLADRYSAPRLEAAAQWALHFGVLSHKGVKNILDSGLDGVEVEDEPGPLLKPIHANVRGSKYYQEGDDDADSTDT